MFSGLLNDSENERTAADTEMAEGVRFELTREQSPLPVFKTGALNHSATLPIQRDQHLAIYPLRTHWQLLLAQTQTGPKWLTPLAGRAPPRNRHTPHLL